MSPLTPHSLIVVSPYRFGGGPAISSLDVCAKCEEVISLVDDTREQQLNEFRRLKEYPVNARYAISRVWMTKWQQFIEVSPSIRHHLSVIACPSSPVGHHLSLVTCPSSSIRDHLSIVISPSSPIWHHLSVIICPSSSTRRHLFHTYLAQR